MDQGADFLVPRPRVLREERAESGVYLFPLLVRRRLAAAVSLAAGPAGVERVVLALARVGRFVSRDLGLTLDILSLETIPLLFFVG